MSRKSVKPTDAARIDEMLRKAFEAIQAEPPPVALNAQIDRLTGRTGKPDRRN